MKKKKNKEKRNNVVPVRAAETLLLYSSRAPVPQYIQYSVHGSACVAKKKQYHTLPRSSTTGTYCYYIYREALLIEL